MRYRLFFLAGLLSLLGCNSVLGVPPARVDFSKFDLSTPTNGQITISGAPGAVTGGGTTTLTLTVIDHNASPIPSPPSGYRVQHFTGVPPVDSTYASVNADGSFPATTLGTGDRPVHSGDELNVTPEAGTQQAGYTAAELIP